jgi:hypothetical protein
VRGTPANLGIWVSSPYVHLIRAIISRRRKRANGADVTFLLLRKTRALLGMQARGREKEKEEGRAYEMSQINDHLPTSRERNKRPVGVSVKANAHASCVYRARDAAGTRGSCAPPVLRKLAPASRTGSCC